MAGDMATANEDTRVVDAIKQNQSEIFIGLFGAAGAGKSSLINTVYSILHGNGASDEIVFTASDELMGGHTLQREPVKLTDHITVVDNRGWHEWTNDKSLKTLADQIDGKCKLSGFVEWTENNEEKIIPAMKSLSPKINCAVIVLKGTAGLDGLQGLDRLQDTCYKGTGRRPIVVITHKDGVSNEELDDIIKTLATVHGTPSSRIFAATNMRAAEPDLEPDSRMSLLSFLQACITDGKAGAAYHERKLSELEVQFQNNTARVEEEERNADKKRERNRADCKFETEFLEKQIVQRQMEDIEMEIKYKKDRLEMEKASKAITSKVWEKNYLEMQKEWFKCQAEAQAKAKFNELGNY